MIYTATCTFIHSSSVSCEISENLPTDFGVHNVGKVDKGKTSYIIQTHDLSKRAC
jgi:hypothetical protein